MIKYVKNVWVADFETSVYEGQTDTKAWACACVKMYTNDVIIFGNIKDFIEFFETVAKKGNTIVYFHNLKFDGNFILYYLLKSKKYKQGIIKEKISENETKIHFKDKKKLENGEFVYSISDRMLMWYSLTLKSNNHFIEFRDSLKLLPFSLKKLCKDFEVEHQKLEMEYTGYRYENCKITLEERKYIKNDVLGLKECLEIMYNQNHKKLTIGSCCYSEFKNITFNFGMTEEKVIPDLTKVDCPIEDFKNADEYIRKSYRGGWCYVVPEKANKIIKNGITLDVNSLYPSEMHSISGNFYPFGIPNFWNGNYIPEEADRKDRYYFIRFRCRFEIKKDFLPFVQIKDNPIYRGTEMLTTSDFFDRKNKKYSRYYYDKLSQKKKDTFVTLTMTCVDFKLFKEHYNVYNLEILDGCWFYAFKGLFDLYIDKYKKIKETSKGCVRNIAKLFLNNLYGKLATNTDSSYKVAYLDENSDTVQFISMLENNKKAGYIAMGSAITSYARNFTIRHAQKNYYGADKKGFIYADTDSIHCDLQPNEIKGIEVHPSDFEKWKLEASWDIGYFVRQKTYIEHVTHENLKKIDKPYYNVKCAGMSERCKDLFIASLTQDNEDIKKLGKMNEKEKIFVKQKREIEDFNIGLVVPSKLTQKRIPGGVLLIETDYEMH